jgi:eukaryotic-like serine/threonine-protein kinase
MTEETFIPDRAKLYHYKLDRILGEGGTGRVYRGIDTVKGEVVAVKRFKENFFRNALHLRDLRKSVKKYKSFNHVNIVRIFDFLDSDPADGICMVMEYVDGPNLKWYILNRPWNLQERLTVTVQICNGLQYLHDNGVIHHDFKPANVLFTRRGVAKVADFSLYGNTLLLELFGAGMGEQITPMFVAPEIIRKEHVTAAADQYSLGITLYMMFAERMPFVVDNIQKLYQCHLRFVPDHPSTVNTKCPRQLGDIIMKLLEKRPENRFKDCDELRIALSGIGRSRI